MLSWLIWLVAVISTTMCLLLWFRDVRRIMRQRKSTMESAKAQYAVCLEKAGKGRDDPEAAAVLARSESIYRQAVELYNNTLKKPWNYFPALVMGFSPVQENGADTLH